jgi:hypothetical protein
MHVGFEPFLCLEHIQQMSTPSSKCHWALHWSTPQLHPDAQINQFIYTHEVGYSS